MSLWALLLGLVQLGYCQEEPTNFNLGNEISRIVSDPLAPEAAAFSNYGNTPINYFSGVPNIEVPLYIHKGIEFDLPITLTYDASGIKVNQLPTTVGLGWNLAIGGRITRKVNALPDDFRSFPPFNQTTPVYESFYNSTIANQAKGYLDENRRLSLSNNLSFSNPNAVTKANNYLGFLEDVHRNEIELQPDLYYVSAPGLSETFVLDFETQTAITLKGSTARIRLYSGTAIASFSAATSTMDRIEVTKDDGTFYEFTLMELTKTENDTGDDGLAGKTIYYNSGWFLTKIISANQRDQYDFIYDNYSSRSEIQQDPLTQMSNPVVSPPDESEVRQSLVNRTTKFFNAENGSNRKSISQVKHNGKVVLGLNWDSTFDNGPDTAVVKIDVFDNEDPDYNERLHKTIDLDYSYFNQGVVDHQNNNNALMVRLKLDKVTISGAEGPVQYYLFEYINPDGLPSLTSNAQDYLGYYNGAPDNQDLFVRNPGNFHQVFGGGTRSPNILFAQNGMLNKITYPTGGITEFLYESAKVTTIDVSQNTVWVERIDFSHSENNLPTFDPEQCNLGAMVEDITPSVGISAAFRVTEEQEGGHKVVYTQTGTGSSNELFEVDLKAYIVRVPDATSTLSWTDLFDAECQEISTEIVWGLSQEWIDLPEYQQTVLLEEGWYRVVLPIHFDWQTKSLLVEGPDETQNIEEIDITKAGLRVKEIKDFTAPGALASKRLFEYKGVELNPVQTYYFTKERYLDWETQQPNVFEWRTRDVLHRPAQFNNANKLHVGYNRVTETVVDNQNDSKSGSTTYRYNIDNYDLSSGEYQQTQLNETGSGNNYAFEDSAGGKIRTSMPGFDDYIQYGDSYISEETFGAYLSANSTHGTYWPVINTTATGAEVLLVSGTEYFNESGWQIQPPSPGTAQNNHFKEEISRLVLREVKYYAKQGGKAVWQESHEIGESGTYVNQKELHYNTLDLLSIQKVLDNEGNEYSTQFEYAMDLNTPGTSTLRNQNKIAIPVQTTSKKNNQTLATKLTEFNGSGLPILVKASKFGEEPLEDRISMSYDSARGITEVRAENGAPTAYLWGYDYRYIVAKIQNASHSQAIGQLGISYSTLQGLEGTSLTTRLNTLRDNMANNFPHALVSTYEYLPSVGVVSQVDPSGVRTNYEFDHFNRLAFVRDADNYIIREYQYNLGLDPGSGNSGGSNTSNYDPISVGNIYLNYNYQGQPFYQGGVSTVSGGSGSYTYKWWYKINDGSYQLIATTSVPEFTLYYDCEPGGEFYGNTIRFRVRVFDADPSVSPKTKNSIPETVFCAF